MPKVKLFHARYASDLEKEINTWIKDQGLSLKIIDIKYQVTCNPTLELCNLFTALIQYTV